MADIKVAAKEALQALWAAVCDAFQVKLVSGENIKTVNGSSLLGSGDLVVSGSGDDTQTTWYGTCSTAAGTAAKVVICSGFTLTTGAIIGVLFSAANTTYLPTLNINSTGAKYIYVGAEITDNTSNPLKWSAHTMLYFMYDGAQYRLITAISGGTRVSPRGANTWVGSCSTAAGTGAKVVSCTNFVMTKGSLVSVTFTYANTAVTPSLNINSTGAKNIYLNNAAGSALNPITWNANETLTFIFSGSYYYLVARDSANSDSHTLPAATSSTLGGVKAREDFGFTMAGTNNEFITQLIEMSVTEAMPDFILASTSSTVVADLTGWHLADVYSDEQAGFMIRRASGVVYGGAVINTSIGGQYRSSSLYIPLPENTYGLVWVSPLGFGCGLGGSSVAGMGALLGGSAASWQYQYGTEKQNLNVMLTAPTSGTGTRYVYFPIEIMYVVI